MEDNELKLPNANEKENQNGNVFTKEVTPIDPVKFFFIGVGNTFKKIGLWILDLLWSIICSIGHFVSLFFVGIAKGIVGVYKYIKHKVHQFKYNDLSGRLSYIWMGASNFKHKQYTQGAIFTILEIAFIVFMAVTGGSSIALLGTLGYTGETTDSGGMFEDGSVKTNNSIMNLIAGILSIFIIIIFVFVWLKNIDIGYNNYRIDNYTKFKTIYEDNIEFCDKIDSLAQDEFNKKVNRFKFRKNHKTEIDEYLNSINAEDKKVRDYVKYLIDESIENSYEYSHKLKRKNIVINFLTKSLNKYTLARKAGLSGLEAKNAQLIASASEENKSEVTEKAQVSIDIYNNKTLAGTTSRNQRLTKQLNMRKELNKTHASFGSVQSIRNRNKFGKFNRYYSDIASIEGELNFYKNYSEFVSKYNGSLTGYIQKNTDNATELVAIKNETEKKISRTKEKFNVIRLKKAELNAKLTAVKATYNAAVKEAQTKGIKEEDLVDAKAELIEKTTRLMGELHDLPSDKSIRALEKEEINETKHAYLRDKKYLKTNFTSESFAREEVINLMILDYKIPYESAVYYADLMFVKDKVAKIRRLLTNEEVEAHVNELEEKLATYKNDHQDMYNGRAESFKEQCESLLNDKFHITILALPILGIVLLTLMPLVFSFLIAFTNFSKLHNETFTWVGFENFQLLLNPDPKSEYAALAQSLSLTFVWTLTWAFFATFSNYFLGIIVALMINKEGIKFKGLWRTVFVMTIAIPAFVSLLTIAQMLKHQGIFEQAFGIKFAGIYDDSPNAIVTKVIIILVNIWVGIPYTMLSTTGILLNIPKDLYESSKVDGAGPITQFFKITMPYILFVTGPYLITSFIGNINNFNVIYFLSGGGPEFDGDAGSILHLGQTDLMITFIYKVVTKNGDFGLASTIGIFVFAICSFFSLIMYNKSGSIQQEDQFQ